MKRVGILCAGDTELEPFFKYLQLPEVIEKAMLKFYAGHIMKTEIVDMSKHFMMLQICDSPEKIDTLIKMLQSISIVEVARTGTLALSKCAENDD